MFRVLLGVLVAEGVAEVQTLARSLNLGAAQVRWMLDELRRLGYLEELESGCSQACEDCPLRAACSPPARARGWRVTERGGGALRPRPAGSV
jgi:hypothetical protein